MAVAVTATAFAFAACTYENKDNQGTQPGDDSDQRAAAVATQFVDNTVAPMQTKHSHK